MRFLKLINFYHITLCTLDDQHRAFLMVHKNAWCGRIRYMHALISSKYICIYISTYVFIDLTTKNTYLLCKKSKKIYLPLIIRRPNPLTLIKFTTFICLILTVQKLVSIVSNHADQITDKIDCIIEMNIVQYQLAYIYT